MGFEEAANKLFDGTVNELNEKLCKTNVKLLNANKERDNALSNAKIANKEKNHLIKALNNLKEEGKLTDEDLSLAGISL